MFEVVKTGLLPSPAPVNGTVRAGSTIYSVQVPRDQSTGKTVEGGIEVQMRQTLQNLKQAIEAGGGTLADITQVIIYLTRKSDFDGMNKVYKEFFQQPYPSRATIVADLIGEGCLVEIVAHAHLGSA
jgi:enamine deaminase RidA (YjgF/YER057c/UK114 family)